MLADNGPPWGSRDERFTALAVWLLRLGIKLYHGRPRHPQTQGKDERFNRTMKNQVLDRYDLHRLSDCQRRFDEWRQIYNYQRTHESVDRKPPCTRYQPSPRAFPAQLPPITYSPGDLVKTVKQKGEITYQNQTYYIGRAFAGLPIALRPTAHDPIRAVYFCWHPLGSIDLSDPKQPKFSYRSLLSS